MAPCTGCKGQPVAAAAASRTARPGGNHSRGCWNEDDCMEKNHGNTFKLGRTNRKTTNLSSPTLQQATMPMY